MRNMLVAGTSVEAPAARRLTLKPLAEVLRGARGPRATARSAPLADFEAQPVGPQLSSWTWRPSAMSDSDCKAHTRCCGDCGGRWLEFRTMLRGCPFCNRRGE